MTARYWNLGPYLEVADCESIAIASTANSLLQDIYIFIDSQAAISRLQGGCNPLAYRARALLARLSALHLKTYISWCPGHKGITGNEIADLLAKRGLQAPCIGQPLITPSYLGAIKRKAYIASWQAIWDREASRGGQGLGKYYQRVVRDSLVFSLKPSFPTGFPRSTQSAYIQLKTSRGYLKPYLRLIGTLQEDLCVVCNCKETTTHLLLYCKRYSKDREIVVKALKGLLLTIQTLLNTKIGRQALFSYLKSTGICTSKWATSAIQGVQGPQGPCIPYGKRIMLGKNNCTKHTNQDAYRAPQGALR